MGADGPSCRLHTFTTGQGCAVDGAFYFEFGPFAVPPSYEQPRSNTMTVVIIALPSRLPRGYSQLPYFLLCAHGGPTTQTDVPFAGGVAGASFYCSDDRQPPLGGHTVLRWTLRGVSYAIGISGGGPIVATQLATEIASRLQEVG
jgi:hypothetical protein